MLEEGPRHSHHIQDDGFDDNTYIYDEPYYFFGDVGHGDEANIKKFLIDIGVAEKFICIEC